MGLEDGMRRYEELLKDIEEKANQALAIALTSEVMASGAVLDIAHGGTGSSVQNFVDLSSNQWDIFGSKRFNASCIFQKQSEIVDSDELAGNVRLVSCDEPGIDIGPQMRYSGRFASDNLTPFAFATTAGRKENDIDGNQAGYFHIATTAVDGHIYEAMRVNSEQNIGFGAVPVIGSGNRVHISGGDVLIDSVGGPRIIKVQIGETFGRIQALENFDGTDVRSDSLIFSVNAELSSNACILDNITAGFGSAAIDVRANTVGVTETGGMIRFLVGDVGECPSIRGMFTIDGLDVVGNAFVTNNIVAGGVNNIVNGVGNSVSNPDGFVTSDNVKFGVGSPEGVVYAPIGAIYGRGSGGSDDPSESSTLWVKVFNDNGNTGWLPVALGAAETPIFCFDTDCPGMVANSGGGESPECLVWYDRSRNIWFYWDPDVVRSIDPDLRGAWLSSDIFQLTVPVTGRSHSQQFRGQIDKDYEYITPMRVNRYKLNMYLLDMTASLRQANNGNDRDANYYTFDLMTLTKRQGDPVVNVATRQEWPGDREPYENKRDNLRGDGHSVHKNLSDDLLALSSTTPSGPPIDGTGTVTSTGNRRVLIDSSKSWTASQWKERDNDDIANNLPANNGYRVRMITGLFTGQERTIQDNTANTLSLRRPWHPVGSYNVPQVGDEYEIIDSQHQRIIARVSTKGNVWPYGAHVDYTQNVSSDPPPLFAEYQKDDAGALVTASQAKSGGLFKTRDVQDFVGSIRNGLSSNDAGGSSDPDSHYIPLDHYVDIFGIESGTEVTPTDAVVLAGLWDAVRRPGKISGVISVSYRLALPPSICDEGATYS